MKQLHLICLVLVALLFPAISRGQTSGKENLRVISDHYPVSVDLKE